MITIDNSVPNSEKCELFGPDGKVGDIENIYGFYRVRAEICEKKLKGYWILWKDSSQSESDILPVGKIETKESYLFDHYINNFDEDSDNRGIKEFIKKFFPEGLPKFTVVTEEIKNTPEYLYNIVFDGERRLAKLFRRKEDSGEKFENLLNNLAGRIG